MENGAADFGSPNVGGSSKTAIATESGNENENEKEKEDAVENGNAPGERLVVAAATVGAVPTRKQPVPLDQMRAYSAYFFKPSYLTTAVVKAVS